MNLELVNEFATATQSSVTSIRWLPSTKQNAFLYATSGGECVIKSAETKSAEILRTNHKEEYLAMDIDDRGQKVAIADKTGAVSSIIKPRSSFTIWATRRSRPEN